jgi:nitroreductase
MDLATVDHPLTTTRSVKKRLDLQRPVERNVIEECLEIATQAPVGGNVPTYHFIVITDPEKKKRIADLYRKFYYESYVPRREKQEVPFPDKETKFWDVTTYLADHFHEVPVQIIPCVQGRRTDPAPMSQASMYGQILPAAWSLMLALRSRGLGACWTTLHLAYEREAAEILGMPEDVTQAALLTVAYYTGKDFRPAKRIPATERTHWNSW